MLRVEVSHVWTRTPDDLIIPRAGAENISFETPDCFENHHDFTVPILIAEGLFATDAAIRIVAHPRTEDSNTESHVENFLVGSYFPDGSGIVVGSSTILREPEVNTTDLMREAWSDLAPNSLTLEDLKLGHLFDHIRPLVINYPEAS